MPQPPIPDIVALEYFIDTDPGFGNGTALSVTTGQNIDENYIIDITGLNLGFHKLFFRTQDSDGKWSLTDLRDIFKLELPVPQPPIPDIIALEYFIDTDPGFGNATSVPITPGVNVNENFFVDLTGLSIGTHYLSFRVKDSDEKWSLTSMYEIIKNNPTITSWTGNVSTEWNITGNWDNGIPDLSITAVIPDVSGASGNFPDITSGVNVECYDLTVNNSANIHNQGALTVNGVLTNLNGTDGLIIESDASGTGSLIHQTPGVSATVERYFTGNEIDWHLVSSPLSNAYSGVFIDMYLQSFSETTGTYSEIIPSNVFLNVMQGYAAYSTLASANTVEFMGNVNTGPLSFNVTNTATAPYGWNLAGNPYPSSIDWNLVIPTLSGINNSIYYLEAATGNWLTWNGTTGSGSRYIPPMQGFFVSAITSATLNLDNSVRTLMGSGTFYKEDVSYLVVIKAEGNGFEDKTYIHFNSEATENFDGQFDAYKILTDYNNELPQIYTKAGTENLSINELPETESVLLGFIAGTSGIYSVSLNEVNDFSEVILDDLKTGETTDLMNNSYGFTYSTGENAERFVLHFTPLAIEESELEKIQVYAVENTIYVKIIDELAEGTISVFNMMGQEIIHNQFNSQVNKITLDSNTGHYIVKVISENRSIAAKVFLK